MELVGSASETTTFTAEWSYTLNCPLEVTATFPAAPEPVQWTFSRDLLADGLREPSGHGDVVAWPEQTDDTVDTDPTMRIWLRTPHGEAELRVSVAALGAFLAQTWQIVPAGQEYDHLNVDEVLDRFFA